MSNNFQFNNKQILGFIWPYFFGGILLVLILIFFWNTPSDITRFSAIIAVFALIITLAVERAKTERKKFVKKHELMVYKRNLLFKLSGMIHDVYWSLSTYITQEIDRSTPNNFMINNITLEKFIELQNKSHEICHEDIRYFSTSDIVPIQIKESLDLLNLHGTKLINFLPFYSGQLNGQLYAMYLLRIISILKWSIEDEESDEIINNTSNLLQYVDLLLEITHFPNFRGFI